MINNISWLVDIASPHVIEKQKGKAVLTPQVRREWWNHE